MIFIWVDQKITRVVPSIVTRNGVAASGAKDLHQVSDHQIIRLKVTPLQSYYVCYLVDNFESTRGYYTRFGLLPLDYSTLEGRSKASY